MSDDEAVKTHAGKCFTEYYIIIYYPKLNLNDSQKQL